MIWTLERFLKELIPLFLETLLNIISNMLQHLHFILQRFCLFVCYKKKFKRAPTILPLKLFRYG